jgi:DNA-directed RNA polymerase subunit RPC12/RpoP
MKRPPPGTVDSDTLARSARRYASLQRRYWRLFFGGMPAFWALGMLPFALEDRLDPVAWGLLAIPGFLGFFACWLGCALTWSSLMRFRCPRCGERFILSGMSSWPDASCKHCGQRLG